MASQYNQGCYEPETEMNAKQSFFAPMPYDKCQMCKDFRRFVQRADIGTSLSSSPTSFFGLVKRTFTQLGKSTMSI